MNKLIDELQRLYFSENPKQADDASSITSSEEGSFTPEFIARWLGGEAQARRTLVGADGRVRAMVVGFDKTSDWEAVAGLYQGIQDDLELPAPAISVSGSAGYQLWLSLAECIPLAEARFFLDALRSRYFAEVSLSNLRCIPDTAQELVEMVPAYDEATGRWSAFIDPSMGAMFIEESGLGMAPNMDRQAEMLSRLESMKAGAFLQAMNILRTKAEIDLAIQEESSNQPSANHACSANVGQSRPKLDVGENFTDPKAFLLAVMNDASANPRDRIEAARALLPYFNGPTSQ